MIWKIKKYNNINSITLYSHDNNIIVTCEWYIEHNYCFITNIFCFHKYRRNGYGTSIVQKLISILKEQNIHIIKVDNCTNENNDFYHKLGFKYIETYYDNNKIKPAEPTMILNLNNTRHTNHIED